MRRDSWRSVPMMQAASGQHGVMALLPFRPSARRCGWRPRLLRLSSAASAFSSLAMLPPSTMSVPRPAILVAMVMAPARPACRHNIRLAGVLLGVQHFVRQFFRLRKLDSSSSFQSRWCPPAPAGRAAGSRGCRRRWRGIFLGWCGTPSPDCLCVIIGLLVGSPRFPGRKSAGIHRLRCRRCRSCPTACGTAGSNSGR